MIFLYLEHFPVWHFLLCILDDAYHFELVIALVDPRCIFKSMGRSFDTSVCPSVPHYSSLNVFGFFSCKLKNEKDNFYEFPLMWFSLTKFSNPLLSVHTILKGFLFLSSRWLMQLASLAKFKNVRNLHK